jgi:hypothetical protein
MGDSVRCAFHFGIVIQNEMHFKEKVLSLKSLVFRSIPVQRYCDLSY